MIIVIDKKKKKLKKITTMIFILLFGQFNIYSGTIKKCLENIYFIMARKKVDKPPYHIRILAGL